MAIVGEAVVIIKGKDEFTATLVKKTSAAQKQMQTGFSSTMQNIGSKMQGVGEKVSGVGDTMSKSISLPFIGAGVAATVFGIKSAAALEQSKIGFTTMLGSAQKADKMIKDLQKFAATTPFEFQGLVQSSQQLLAMGFTSKQIIPTMTAVGDAVAAMGGSEENVAAVTRALGQMQAKGKASSEEMLQLTEQGIPAWDMLAKKMGVSTQEAMKAVQNGQVSSTTAINAVVEGSEKRFGGMMEKQSKTFSGQMSNLHDTIQQQLGAAFAEILPKLTEIIKQLTPVTAEFIHNLVPAIQATADAMIPLIKAVVILLKGFNALPGPMQKVVLGLTAIVVAAGPVMSVGGRIVTYTGKMIEGFGKASEATSKFAGPGGGMDTIRLRAMMVGDKLKQFGSTAGSAFAKAGKAIGTATANIARSMWTMAASLATNPVFLIIAAVVALVAALVILYIKWKPFREMVNSVGQAVGHFFVDAFHMAIDAFHAFVGAMETVWKLVVNIVKKYGLILLAVLL